MKRIPLIIHGDKLTKKQLIVGNWNFHKVVFKSIDKNLNTEILYSLESIRSNIREIEFIDCCVGEEKVFQNILEYFPIVEKLSFINCSIKFPNQKSNAEVLKLENLNELVLMGSTMEVNYDVN